MHIREGHDHLASKSSRLLCKLQHSDEIEVPVEEKMRKLNPNVENV